VSRTSDLLLSFVVCELYIPDNKLDSVKNSFLLTSSFLVAQLGQFGVDVKLALKAFLKILLILFPQAP